MIGTYFGIALTMLVVFFIAVVGIPAVYILFSYLNFVGQGNSFDEYNWEDYKFLSVLDDFLDSLKAYNAEDRTFACGIIIVILSLFWVIGIPVYLYFSYTIVQRVKAEKYEELLKRQEEYRKKNMYTDSEDM